VGTAIRVLGTGVADTAAGRSIGCLFFQAEHGRGCRDCQSFQQTSPGFGSNELLGEQVESGTVQGVTLPHPGEVMLIGYCHYGSIKMLIGQHVLGH
jgi:hypothetical protein